MNDLLRSFSLSVDLAVEARDLVRGATGREISGVIEDVKELPHCKVTTITIKDPKAEAIMGRPVGSYVTIESDELSTRDPLVIKETAKALGDVLVQMLGGNPRNDLEVMIVGLGNRFATPDALGSRVIEQLPATRHVHKYIPEAVLPGMRSVCAITPGVLGLTGIETAEIVQGVVEKVKPQVVIIIDALAAQNTERIGTTIQSANTGIQPGGGVGNARAALNQQTLGVPVISIGAPTVVAAAIIAHEAIHQYCKQNNINFNDQAAIRALQTLL
ncbi:MAG: GPR endopeptidase, partial [Methylocystaceae bacterium]